jgi:hypothetical protein
MSLRCRNCWSKLSAYDILDLACYTIPGRWQVFACKECNRSGYFSINDSSLQVGAPDGFPGPSFIPESEQLVVGLSSEELPDGSLEVKLDGRTWLISVFLAPKSRLTSMWEKVRVKFGRA